ncbi:hypothetical protein J6I75_07705 [Pseudidiomarina sp. 1APP75-27a]|uniref:hypothetical protein n=1 Tax=Pseudidiomarina terrestris TaxID=2820060 RepID=UPI00264DACDB|nr:MULTISPECIES: hypothetical protein [unclassified Pseudidiomarina]MDN7125833.1 hypothetical protein [Pseudidiomarina sp. 1APR75-33.1]MEA3588237.1 hypothetical protein [Pseudidiomarina sp. 1APP75-27a]
MTYNTMLPVVLLLLCPAAQAETSTSTWTFANEFEAGYLYDSNVGLSQIDENTTESDQALQLRGKLQLGWQATEQLNISTSYQYQNKNYRDFSSFDQEITTLMADINYQLAWFKVGVSQHNADAKVAHRDFLDFRQTSYYLADLIGDSIYWRLGHQRLTKTLQDYPARNAAASNYSADLFWFFHQGSRFVTFGYTHEDEVAADAKFSYLGHQLRSSLNQTLDLWGHAQKLSLSVDYKNRDYSSAWLPNQAARQDNVTTFEGQWQAPLSKHFTLAVTAKHTNSASTVEAADYRDTSAGVSLQLEF